MPTNAALLTMMSKIETPRPKSTPLMTPVSILGIRMSAWMATALFALNLRHSAAMALAEDFLDTYVIAVEVIPLRASWRAMARPKPWLALVTIAFLPPVLWSQWKSRRWHTSQWKGATSMVKSIVLRPATLETPEIERSLRKMAMQYISPKKILTDQLYNVSASSSSSQSDPLQSRSSS